MLVLSRRVGESVMVGADVVVTILEVRGDVVRVGVNAPRHIKVHREEVFLAVQQQNLESASPSEAAVAALARVLPAPKEQPAPAELAGD